MYYTLMVTSCTDPSIDLHPDGDYQIRLISKTPLNVTHGMLFIEDLHFKNNFDRYWLEYLGRCKKIWPLDWYVLKYLQENGSNSVLNINLYLESVKDKIPKTKLPLTHEGKKGIRKRINGILTSLECSAHLSIDTGMFELHVRTKGG